MTDTDNARADCGCDLSVGPNALHIVDDHDAVGPLPARCGVGSCGGAGVQDYARTGGCRESGLRRLCG